MITRPRFIGRWTGVRLHPTIDAVLANDLHHGRWRDLANLGWTCRDAYRAAHPRLWQHLRLVFRIDSERVLPVQSPDRSTHFQQLSVQYHTQVLESSVFPCFRHGQLVGDSERLKRIRAVSKEYPHLQPFVVLDGKLFLASLVENERNTSDPDPSGITPLWVGDRSGNGQGIVSSGIRVAGGLVLVPYPLHLTQELTMDALASATDIGSHRLTPRKLFPFLFSMDRQQVRTLSFFSDSGRTTSNVYNDVLWHFRDAVNHDFLLDGGTHYYPSFRQATRSVRIYHGEDFDSDGDLYSIVGELPAISSFQHFGSGTFDMEAADMRLFLSNTLTRLDLDFDVHTSPYNTVFVPFNVHLPLLKELLLNMQVANAFVFHKDSANIMYPPSPPLGEAAFPSLTHLSLVNVHHIRGDNVVQSVPWIPFHHMPQLTHLHIPLVHRGFHAIHYIKDSAMRDLASFTHITSLDVPGLVLIYVDDTDENDLPPLVDAPHLTHVHAKRTVITNLSRVIATPSLVSIKLFNVHDVQQVLPTLS